MKPQFRYSGLRPLRLAKTSSGLEDSHDQPWAVGLLHSAEMWPVQMYVGQNSNTSSFLAVSAVHEVSCCSRLQRVSNPLVVHPSDSFRQCHLNRSGTSLLPPVRALKCF